MTNTPHNPSIPYGYCHCGCGKMTNLAPFTDASKGWVAKRPLRFIKGHYGRMQAKEDYLVDPDTGCWVWQKSMDSNGYGSFQYRGFAVKAHRFYYFLKNGHLPEGASICHHCGNPSCVNPDHLYAGDSVTSMQDR